MLNLFWGVSTLRQILDTSCLTWYRDTWCLVLVALHPQAWAPRLWDRVKRANSLTYGVMLLVCIHEFLLFYFCNKNKGVDSMHPTTNLDVCLCSCRNSLQQVPARVSWDEFGHTNFYLSEVTLNQECIFTSYVKWRFKVTCHFSWEISVNWGSQQKVIRMVRGWSTALVLQGEAERTAFIHPWEEKPSEGILLLWSTS